MRFKFRFHPRATLRSDAFASSCGFLFEFPSDFHATSIPLADSPIKLRACSNRAFRRVSSPTATTNAPQTMKITRTPSPLRPDIFMAVSKSSTSSCEYRAIGNKREAALYCSGLTRCR
jgi:hypothetical protein